MASGLVPFVHPGVLLFLRLLPNRSCAFGFIGSGGVTLVVACWCQSSSKASTRCIALSAISRGRIQFAAQDRESREGGNSADFRPTFQRRSPLAPASPVAGGGAYHFARDFGGASRVAHVIMSRTSDNHSSRSVCVPGPRARFSTARRGAGGERPRFTNQPLPA